MAIRLSQWTSNSLLLGLLYALSGPGMASDRGVTLSHVYKIDVAEGADCKLTAQLLPTQDQAAELQGATEMLSLGGDNDVVFRHNIHLQSPKCGCEDSESFKALLYRIKALEEEVAHLKKQCSQGCCSADEEAVDYACSGHGNYERSSCSCVCDAGWEGPDCSTSTCPYECNDNGRCVEGRCVCYEGYGGEDCGQLVCPNDCNDKGSCEDGVCVCFSHYTGEDCSIRRCPGDCVGNGHCVDGTCICDEGFFGEDCSRVMGPENLRLLRVTEESLLVEWNPVTGVEYCVLTYHPEGDEGTLQRVRVPHSNSYLITGLSPGVTYIVDVYAVIKQITSEPSTLKATTVVSSVDGIRVLGQTEDTIQVDWQNPAAEMDYFMLTHASPEGEEEELTVPKSQEARTKHTIIGLYPGTEYLITVQAIKGSYKGTPSTVIGVTDLDAPTNLETKEVTVDTVIVTWDQALADVDGYTVSYSSADGSSEEIPVGPDSTSYRLSGLRPGVLYTVYVWGVKDDRTSRKSSTQAETGLDAPTNLVTREITEDTVTVTWDTMLASVDGYMVSYSSADGSSEEILVGVDSTSYRFTGLTPGVLYTVYVWGVKGNCTSRKSSIQAETGLDAPTNLETVEVTEDTVTVTWDSMLADVDGYMVSYSSADGSSEEILVGVDSTSYRFTGLTPGVLYTVYVWGVKGDRTSRKSSIQAETGLDAPTNLVAREVTEDTVTVTWDSMLASVDGYMVSYSSADGSSEEILVGVDSTSCRFTGLTPGVLYTVNVWGVKGDQTSKKISTQAETELDAPTNLETVEVTEDTVTVTWDSMLADVDGYMVSYSSADGSSEEILVGVDSTSYRFTGLTPGVLYTVYVWGVKGDRTSRKSSIQAETGLDAPTNLETVEVTEDTVTVTWDSMLASVDGYMVSYSSADGSSEEILVGVDSTSYRFTGLTPGVLYTVNVWGVKGDQTSKKISTQAETEIDAPTNLRVSNIQLDTADMTWTVPQANIEGYVLMYRAGDGSGQVVEQQLAAAATRFALANLEMGQRHLVTLKAYRGSKTSKPVETTFTTVGLVHPFPMDCTQVLRNGMQSNGIYTIYINNNHSKPIQVYCDMITDGGGWIVLQRRSNGKVDFMKRWRQYIQGFGNLTDEFWLGLQKMYELTNTSTKYELRVDLKLGSESTYAIYDNFRIAPIKEKFALTVGTYRGTAGDALTYHNSTPFSTVDSDNDISLNNCALIHLGAWWYKNCHLANLNGKYGDTRHSVGLNWKPWKGHVVSLDATEMKIRPVGYAGATLGRKRRSLGGRKKNRKMQPK